jgi:hypothetical protein
VRAEEFFVFVSEVSDDVFKSAAELFSFRFGVERPEAYAASAGVRWRAKLAVSQGSAMKSGANTSSVPVQLSCQRLAWNVSQREEKYRPRRLVMNGHTG